MSKSEEGGLILKLYELRRDDTMRKARDWYFREFNPESMADITAAMFSEQSGYLRMVLSYSMTATVSILVSSRNSSRCSAKYELPMDHNLPPASRS
jgi:hypothetical protein